MEKCNIVRKIFRYFIVMYSLKQYYSEFCKYYMFLFTNYINLLLLTVSTYDTLCKIIHFCF